MGALDNINQTSYINITKNNYSDCSIFDYAIYNTLIEISKEKHFTKISCRLAYNLLAVIGIPKKEVKTSLLKLKQKGLIVIKNGRISFTIPYFKLKEIRRSENKKTLLLNLESSDTILSNRLSDTAMKKLCCSIPEPSLEGYDGCCRSKTILKNKRGG